jgi:hypothetical protein
VKNTPKGPTVNKTFKLCYGIDSNKLMLGASLSSEELKNTKVLEDFALALAQVKGSGKGTGPRTDILNVAKITSNLIFLGGGAQGRRASEVFLLTSISFPRTQSVQVEPYFFSYVDARASQEMPDALMPAVAAADASGAAQKKQLFEPTITGDKPVEVEKQMMDEQLGSYVDELEDGSANASQSASADAVAETDLIDSIDQIDAGPEEVSDVTDPEFAEKYRAMKNELEKHKRLSEALAADVKRLMKERREPLTSADLKESLHELNVRLKHLQEQNKKLSDLGHQKDEQIELLTAQVERLKVKAA